MNIESITTDLELDLICAEYDAIANCLEVIHAEEMAAREVWSERE